MKRLEKYKDTYNFNCQLYGGTWQIYVSKNDVDLTDTGGHVKLSDAVKVIVEWLNRVNTGGYKPKPKQKPHVIDVTKAMSCESLKIFMAAS